MDAQRRREGRLRRRGCFCSSQEGSRPKFGWFRIRIFRVLRGAHSLSLLVDSLRISDQWRLPFSVTALEPRSWGLFLRLACSFLDSSSQRSTTKATLDVKLATPCTVPRRQATREFATPAGLNRAAGPPIFAQLGSGQKPTCQTRLRRGAVRTCLNKRVFGPP